MDSLTITEIVVNLGVPGLALIILWFVFQHYRDLFRQIGSPWNGIIVLTIVLCTSALVGYALYKYNRSETTRPETITHEGELSNLANLMSKDSSTKSSLTFSGSTEQRELLRRLFIHPAKSAESYTALMEKICEDPGYSCLNCGKNVSASPNFVVSIQSPRTIAKCKVESADAYCCAD